MQLTSVLRIRSPGRIREFMQQEHVGRLATLDADGYPQVIPVNFAFLNDVVYMHSFVRGEKLDNMARDSRAGFEVDRELEFLPSYFEDPHDASLADTLYVSVVIKGEASVVSDRNEKTLALNGLMLKYQPEGRYDPIAPDMRVLDGVAVIKVVPKTMHGKYKIGQQLSVESRTALAYKILERNMPTAKSTLAVMGFEVTKDGLRMVDEPAW